MNLCKCKVDLRSMSITSKLCNVAYHSTRLDETNVFKLFLDTLDQKTITTKKTNVTYEKVFVIYSEKMMTPFWTCDFLKFYASYKKRMTYLES